MSETRPIVAWTEIPVIDMDRGCDFYAKVFGWTMTRDDSGPNPMAVFDGRSAGVVSGHIYPGTPGQGPTIHLTVPDTVETAADRCTASGGRVLGPVISIPAGRFQYATDPDGNSIGLFEMAA
ncbi:VOC family protein [Pelagovum pacificum]|uniref:VOC family protein n=1 Tax=Pelagovum pacificum TaxID=2588711 RepID=A0A5C5GFU1_9RHOB|nr:VOC family protein [Pelagovum pacificum]QQA43474.1 VOC family protein [Pelagovum pacificum]TNY33390.1 VOC family protein [Pelagovum pacificum]